VFKKVDTELRKQLGLIRVEPQVAPPPPPAAAPQVATATRARG
jgi:hypothetical protein